MHHEIEIIGYLGRDPEMRYTPTGSSVTSFSVAASRVYKDAGGEKISETVWFNATAWGKTGEICNQFLRKGSKVFIKGRLAPDKKTGRPRIWEDKNGIAGASYDVVVTTIKFLSDRHGGNESVAAEEAPVDDNMPPEEIPF